VPLGFDNPAVKLSSSASNLLENLVSMDASFTAFLSLRMCKKVSSSFFLPSTFLDGFFVTNSTLILLPRLS